MFIKPIHRMFRAGKNPEMRTGDQLLQEYLKTGDLEILGSLYSRYMHLVYGVCLKYLSDRERAKDAVSQIFEHLITEIPKFEIQNFKSWLYVVTKNFCLMEIRKQKSFKNRFEKYSVEQNMESTEILHPLDEGHDSLLEENLKRCIERLKKEQQQCIRLFYYEEKSYKEVSEELDIPLKKVKSYIQNGKRNLKICLEQFAKQHEV